MAGRYSFWQVDARMGRGIWLDNSYTLGFLQLCQQGKTSLLKKKKKNPSTTPITMDVPFSRISVHFLPVITQLALSWLITRLQQNGTNHHFGNLTFLDGFSDVNLLIPKNLLLSQSQSKWLPIEENFQTVKTWCSYTSRKHTWNIYMIINEKKVRW